jgi:DNA-binding transcriptional MerR regulator
MTTSYRIAEIARRSGFSRPTLRYYEEIGLLPPPTRTEAGYRIYDDGALDRLSFIARAKELGCSLDEIVELSALWAGDRCAPVREQLHSLVTTKIGEAQRRVAELVRLTADLQAAAAKLGASTPSDERPCGDDCACSRAVPAPGDGSGESARGVPLIPTALVETGPENEVACTLDPEMVHERIAEWQGILGLVRAREPLPNGVRLEFDAAPLVEELTRLAVAEQTCCEFFSFAVTIDGRGIGLEVQGPPEARAVVDAAFGLAQ